MNYCVIDTERIKGDLIYLFSYQIYDANYQLIESKTFQDISIDLSNRKSPKTKTKLLDSISIKVKSFEELYGIVSKVMVNNKLIVFSDTDVKVIRKKCKELSLQYEQLKALDLQEILYDLSTDDKHKSNLKGFASQMGIKHNPHIPESDCYATIKLYEYLLNKYGEEFLKKYIKNY